MKQMENLCDFDGIFVGLQSTLNPNIERTTHLIDMIVSVFDRYDVTLSNDNKIKMEKHREGSKFQQNAGPVCFNPKYFVALLKKIKILYQMLS